MSCSSCRRRSARRHCRRRDVAATAAVAAAASAFFAAASPSAVAAYVNNLEGGGAGGAGISQGFSCRSSSARCASSPSSPFAPPISPPWNDHSSTLSLPAGRKRKPFSTPLLATPSDDEYDKGNDNEQQQQQQEEIGRGGGPGGIGGALGDGNGGGGGAGNRRGGGSAKVKKSMSARRLLRRARIRILRRGREGGGKAADGRAGAHEKESSVPASSPSRQFSSAAASYRTIVAFISTTVLIWLSEPLLSLVDTTVVGRFASTAGTSAGGSSAAVVALASLGPATLLTDNALYLTYFLAIATTNRLAPALAKKDWSDMVRTTSHVLGVAIVLGLAITAVISWRGSAILASILGDAGSAAGGEGVLASALEYAKIRAYVAPLAVADCVAQSVCLATLDMRTPALAVVAASLTNIVGDWLLVVRMGMGVKGAALATAAATTVSAGMLLAEVRKKVGQWKNKEGRGTPNGVNGVNGAAKDFNGVNSSPGLHIANGGNNNKEQSETEVDGKRLMLPEGLGVMGSKATKEALLAEGVPLNATVLTTLAYADPPPPSPSSATSLVMSRRARRRRAREQKREAARSGSTPFVSLPDRSSLLALVTLAGPIFFVMLGKIACYTALTLRAADFGVTALASHNVLLRVFFFYATFGDAFSQAAQSFLPAAMVASKEEGKVEDGGEGEVQKDRSGAVRTLIRRMLLLSTVISVLNSQVGRYIVRSCGSHFASDPAVTSLLSSNARYFGLALLLHPAIMLFEGVIIARRDLGYLASTYGATLLGLGAVLKFGCGGGFGDVWRALFLFQAIRLAQFGTRVWSKTVRGGNGSVNVEGSSTSMAKN